MTLVQIRNAIAAQLNNNWVHAGVPVFYANAEEIDIALIGTHFLKCDVYFDDAQQINIDPAPHHRTYGTLVLTVLAREAEGTTTTLGYLDELTTLFKFKALSGVHTQTPKPGMEVYRDGWFSMQLRVPFWADSNT